MSFLVAVMPAPSRSLMMPFSCSSSRARASLVVSLGTAIFREVLLEPQPVRARDRISARTSAVSFTEVFFMMYYLLVIINTDS